MVCLGQNLSLVINICSSDTFSPKNSLDFFAVQNFSMNFSVPWLAVKNISVSIDVAYDTSYFFIFFFKTKLSIKPKNKVLNYHKYESLIRVLTTYFVFFLLSVTYVLMSKREEKKHDFLWLATSVRFSLNEKFWNFFFFGGFVLLFSMYPLIWRTPRERKKNIFSTNSSVQSSSYPFCVVFRTTYFFLYFYCAVVFWRLDFRSDKLVFALPPNLVQLD